MIILLDMDGVIADFVSRSIEVAGLPLLHETVCEWDYFKRYMTSSEFWRYIDNHEGFWENLDPYPWAAELVDVCKSIGTVYYASAPALHHNCCEGKIKWLRKHGFMSHTKNDYMFGPDKWMMARKGRVLIDDNEQNIKSFRYAGGYGILFPQPWNSADSSIDRVTDIKIKLENLNGKKTARNDLGSNFARK